MIAITVRPAAISDLDDLVPLFDAYRQFYRLPSDETRARVYLAERLAGGESVVFLAFAEAASEPVGFVQLYPAFSSLSMGRAWMLNDLYVKPESRRDGAARALLERARHHALETGALYLELETAVDNIAAQRLYESLGWRRSTGFHHYELRVAP